MNTKKRIQALARRRGSITSAEVVAECGISRQAAAKHLRQLVSRGEFVKLGITRNARYVPVTALGRIRKKPLTTFRGNYSLRNLDESTVFREIDLRMRLSEKLSKRSYGIANYAFTEMLNNAIDHSRSVKSEVRCVCMSHTFEFTIRDYGIGVFESVRKKFRLKDHFEAVEHILKGKQSTDPTRHSGQGIFFTSKVGDFFSLTSSREQLSIDNKKNDIFLKERRSLKGTRVHFVIKRQSRTELKKIFDEYSDTKYSFDKTRIMVRLSSQKDENVSRSQAKRLLFGLEKFTVIELDFAGVRGIGQGFADEIFRVFLQKHPDIRIMPRNAGNSVQFMINRVMRAKRHD